MSRVYRSFEEVYLGVKQNIFPNEAGLRQAFIEALKNELGRSRCHKYIVEQWLKPELDEIIKSGRPDIRISNIVIEVEPPGAGLKEGLKQVKQYMEELHKTVRGRVDIYGLVTDGDKAILLRYNGSTYTNILEGEMPIVAKNLIETFCSSKIPLTKIEDLIRLFGM